MKAALVGRAVAGFALLAKWAWRKVRSPQGDVPANGRGGRVKAALRKVPQRIYRLVFWPGKGEKVR